MLTFSLDKATGFTADEIIRIKYAAKMLTDVLNNPMFKSELSDPVMYDLIMSGYEQAKPDKDECINIDITLYNKWWSRTIGYTYPGQMRTWINKKFFKNFTSLGLSEHIMHEHCHLQGRPDKGVNNAYYLAGVYANTAHKLGYK